MNKAVKIILAIAIGILYPVLTFLLALTVFPDYKGPGASYPQYPSTSECKTTSSSVSNRSSYNYSQSCEDRLREQYDNDVKKYETDRKNGVGEASKVSANRIKLTVAVVLIGFLIALVVKAVSPVSAGLAGGSMVLVVFSAGFAVAAEGNVDIVGELLFLLVFIELVVLMFVVDFVFKPLQPAVQSAIPSIDKNDPPPKESK